jgi:hypothetical protein
LPLLEIRTHIDIDIDTSAFVFRQRALIITCDVLRYSETDCFEL